MEDEVSETPTPDSVKDGGTRIDAEVNSYLFVVVKLDLFNS